VIPASWLEAARGVPVAHVLAALGRRVTRQRWGPCPSCGAEKVGHDDRREPVGVTRDGEGWRCHRCAASGDALDLVALDLTGKLARDLAGDAGAWASVRDWYAARGWCDPSPTSPRPAPAPRRIPPPPPPEEAPPAPWPDPGEVAALWAACGRVDPTGSDLPTVALSVAAWLSLRGLWAPSVASLDLARVLPAPREYGYPPWLPARWWPSWALAVPTWTAAGELAGLRFRRLDGGGAPKERAPLDRRSSGLALACPVALDLLRGEPDRAVWDGTVLLVEGVPDFLTWATAPGVPRPAVLGIYAGAWTPAHAARIPDGTRVALGTHADRQGDRFAAELAATLAGRCPCSRVRP